MQNRFLLPWFITIFALGMLGGYILSNETQVARARPAVQSAPQAVPTVVKKLNADFVDNLHAAKAPMANRLLALDANAQFPGSVIPNTLGHDLNATNFKAGAPAHADCNTGGDVCGDDDVVADDDVTAGDDVEVGGDLEQSLAGNGSVKAALFVNCSSSSPEIFRSFVTVTGYSTTPTITAGSSGECVIDFNFNVIDRYIVLQANYSGLGLSEKQAVYKYLSDDTIQIRRTDSSGTAENGAVAVIVY